MPHEEANVPEQEDTQGVPQEEVIRGVLQDEIGQGAGWAHPYP